MAFQLRNYQSAAVEAAVAFAQTAKPNKAGLLVLPTGAGKSLVIAEIVARLEGRTVVFQPSKEILRQNASKMAALGLPVAVWSAALNRREVGEITMATVGSVVRRPEAFDDVVNVVIDECHLGTDPKAGQFKRFLKTLDGVRLLGLTATPYRLANNSLGSELRFLTRTRPRFFTDVVYHSQVGDLLTEGFLCPVRYKRVPLVDRRRLDVNTTGTDYTDRSVRRHYAEISFAQRLADGVDRLLGSGRKSVAVFTRFVDEAEAVAARLGDLATVVSSKTPARERDAAIDGFKSGRYRVACNVGILGIGFDHPALDTVVLARPTRSLSVYYQQVGRALRPHPSKDFAVAVDLVGVTEQFGQVEDLELRPGGKTGAQWAYFSGRRQLTNVYLQEQEWL